MGDASALRRRDVTVGLLSTGASCVLSRPSLATGDTVFPFSVASGDPCPDRVVIWTRLARPTRLLEPFSPHPVEVRWIVAADPGLGRPIRHGTAFARPEEGFSVHVDVAGLHPDSTYYYAFFAHGEKSPTGRTKTLPALLADLQTASFAVVSCQNWENGYFDAYRSIIEDDPQFIIHLGDYIYDVTRGGGVRTHETSKLPMTLADYRARHALYRSDPALIAAHEALPFILMPDNHDALEDAPESPEALARRSAAYQAWYEFLPVRHRPYALGRHMQIYRGTELGILARFNLLDTRQFRNSETVCRNISDPRYAFGVYERTCFASGREERSMLGRAQEAWLSDRLKTTHATWNFVLSTVMMTPVDLHHDGETYTYQGTWDGYPANRTRLLTTLAKLGTPNPVVFSGDLHSNLVGHVTMQAGRAPDRYSPPEFLGTSISSKFPPPLSRPFEEALQFNPQILHYDSQHRGYLRITVKPASLIVETRLMNFTDKPGGRAYTGETFVVLAGARRIHVG